MSPSAPDDFHTPSPQSVPEEDLGLDLVEEIADHSPTRRQSPAKKWILLALVAAVVVAGVVSLVMAFSPRDLVAEVAAAADKAEKTVQIEGGGTAAVSVAASVDAGSIVLEGLPAPRVETVYQVWVLADETGDPSSLAVLSQDAVSGSFGFKGLDGIEGVAVTAEPAGGSDAPTTDPLFTTDLPGQ